MAAHSSFSADSAPPKRIVFESVQPIVDGGRFPIRRVIGESVEVKADIFIDGHETLAARVLYKQTEATDWSHTPLKMLGNDHWVGEFYVESIGCHQYTLEAWIDRWTTWRIRTGKKLAAGKDVSVDLTVGIGIIERCYPDLANAAAQPAEQALRLLQGKPSATDLKALLDDDQLATLLSSVPDQESKATFKDKLPLWVDRKLARFSSWYECFPRSSSLIEGRHGTFFDLIERLPYISNAGFDVLYLPPIHPIGRTHRKGLNNKLKAGPNDPGSPWGIGSLDGGHKAIHPELGSFAHFEKLLEKAAELGVEIALDIALQCSPDHPYVRDHPEWFAKRPDGSIQYAENPPKEYQDIYPLDFECVAWQALYEEVKSIFDFWIGQGVRIFRVDNPHTKPFAFWEWLIGGIKSEHPDVLFLAEAFTRPRVMQQLAKLGFTQSYTYFTWRNNKWELEQYFRELAHEASREYFIPNLWPNTPDILHEYLQTGGKSVFIARLVLAAAGGANYGIYGPAFELCVDKPRELGTEEYLDSEKYEIKHWNLDDPINIIDVIRRVNRARKDNLALQHDWSLTPLPIDNPFLVCFSKSDPRDHSIIIAVVNLDPFNTQIGWIDLPLSDFGLGWDETYEVHDLLTDESYLWHGSRNYIELNPFKMPAHLLKLKKITPTE